MPDVANPVQNCVALRMSLGRWDNLECSNQAVTGAVCQVVARPASACVPTETTTRKPPPKPPATTHKPPPKPPTCPKCNACCPKPTKCNSCCPKPPQPPKCQRAYVCPNGWTIFGAACYQYVGSGMNYTEATAACKAKGGRLPVIKSAQQADIVYEFSQLYTKDDEACKTKAEQICPDCYKRYACHLWLGLELISGSNGTFRWSDGTTLNNGAYANWASGEPDHVTGENCGQMFTRSFEEGDAKQWNDVNCSRLMKVVCEQQAKQINFAPNTCTP